MDTEKKVQFVALTKEEIDAMIQQAALAGAQVASDAMMVGQRKSEKEKIDRRLHNTDLLLRNYRTLKASYENAVYKSKEGEVTEVLEDIMTMKDDKVIVESIKTSAKRTAIMVQHIDKMLDVYRIYCSKLSEKDKRRYKIIKALYISKTPMTIAEISKKFSVSKVTVYEDIKIAKERLSSLFFGIDDDRNVIGLSDAQIDAETISRLIKERITPYPSFVLAPERENGKDILVLSVSSGRSTPYYYKADGIMEAYIRMGNESVIAPSYVLNQLILKGMHRTYDELVSEYDFKDYAFSKLRERYKAWTGNSMEEKLFDSFDMRDENGKLTNAGALLADDSPIRHSRLFCTRWNGLDKSGGMVDALDSAEFSGSLIILLNEGVSFVKRNMKTRWKKTADFRVGSGMWIPRSRLSATPRRSARTGTGLSTARIRAIRPWPGTVSRRLSVRTAIGGWVTWTPGFPPRARTAKREKTARTARLLPESTARRSMRRAT